MPKKISKKQPSDSHSIALQDSEELYQKLLNYAFRILAKKRYTNYELERKMRQYIQRRDLHKKLPPTALSENLDPNVSGPTLRPKFSYSPGSGSFSAVLKKILKRLLELKYLDDEQYAKDYISTKVRLRPRGIFLLKRDLKLKGISEELTEQCLQEFPVDEFEVAMNAIVKKEKIWGEMEKTKKKAKAIRFLSSKGFSAKTIYKTVDNRYNTLTRVES